MIERYYCQIHWLFAPFVWQADTLVARTCLTWVQPSEIQRSHCDNDSTTFVNFSSKPHNWLAHISHSVCCLVAVYLIILNTSVSKTLLTTLIGIMQRHSNVKLCIFWLNHNEESVGGGGHKFSHLILIFYLAVAFISASTACIHVIMRIVYSHAHSSSYVKWIKHTLEHESIEIQHLELRCAIQSIHYSH